MNVYVIISGTCDEDRTICAIYEDEKTARRVASEWEAQDKHDLRIRHGDNPPFGFKSAYYEVQEHELILRTSQSA